MNAIRIFVAEAVGGTIPEEGEGAGGAGSQRAGGAGKDVGAGAGRARDGKAASGGQVNVACGGIDPCASGIFAAGAA